MRKIDEDEDEGEELKESFHRKRRIKINVENSNTKGERVKNVLCEKKGIILEIAKSVFEQ